MYHCKDSLSSINGVVRPGIVHRIDKDTSGLLMIAKNDFAHSMLAEQLAEHSITRVYTALVYNNFAEDEGTVDVPIGRDAKNRLRQTVFPYENGQVPKGAKRAVTNYCVLKRYGRFTLIEARLLTGRTHQIRVHMAYIKHPLVGDTVYGPKNRSWERTGDSCSVRVCLDLYIHGAASIWNSLCRCRMNLLRYSPNWKQNNE